MFKLKQEGVVLAFFPLHDEAHVTELERVWARNYWQMPWQQPLWKIQTYLGEKIGLYFAFLGHYTTWLLIPGRQASMDQGLTKKLGLTHG